MKRIAGAVVVFFVLTGISCPPAPPTVPGTFTIASVVLSGPTSMPNDGPNSTYSAVVTINRAPGDTGQITITSPFWLVDEDSPLGGNDTLSFTSGVVIPVNSSTATVTWDLGCVDRTVRGTALTNPGGSPNNNDSGEGNAYSFGPDSGPADMLVQFQGNFVSNAIFVSCMCNGAVCP